MSGYFLLFMVHHLNVIPIYPPNIGSMVFETRWIIQKNDGDGKVHL